MSYLVITQMNLKNEDLNLLNMFWRSLCRQWQEGHSVPHAAGPYPGVQYFIEPSLIHFQLQKS